MCLMTCLSLYYIKQFIICCVSIVPLTSMLTYETHYGAHNNAYFVKNGFDSVMTFRGDYQT